ncbi:MAG: phosphoglucosamine mutase [Lentisphaerae bacterium GWF2_45_14]|nr:MAG: phosphoglucosamine mutase [Lentisphaerae bacterium GWF2_45_14]
MKRKQTLKVGVSGVRGIIGDSLTPGLICGFAASFGEYVGQGRVVVSRDTRPTGEMVEHAVIAGLISVGCQPLLTGVLPTPSAQILVDECKANGGIVISASHNTVEWNALKFIGPSGLFLNHTESAELLDVYNQPDTTYVKEQDYRSIKTIDGAFDYHKKRIFNRINVDAVRKAGFRVAVDCCNGAGSLFSRAFLQELGCEVISIYDEADGIFRRPPEPIPANIGKLCSTVVENNCAVGFAQDPDCDRISIVREDGIPAGEQFSIVLAAEHVLSKTPGNIVVNIQTTRAIEDVASKYGANVLYSKVGEVNVTGRMLEENAVIGGEGGSGGVIWPAVHPCRDSFTAMALILEMMALRGKSLSSIIEEIPAYFYANRKISCSAVNAQEAVRKLNTKYASLNPKSFDGIRIDFPDAWILVRPSNTEPVIRLTAEALHEKVANELIERFSSEISGMI